MLDVCNQRQSLFRNYSHVRIPPAGKLDDLAYPLDPENEEISEVMLRHFHQTYLAYMGEGYGPGDSME